VGNVQLVGPSYNLESRPASVQRTVNMVPVPLEPGNERAGWGFEDVPGLTSFSTPPLVELVSGWWEFEENDSSESFLDSTGNAHHLTTTLATSSLSVAGGLVGRAQYRGGDSAGLAGRRVYIPRSDTRLDFGPNQAFTIGAWINPRAGMVTGWTRPIIGRAGFETPTPSTPDASPSSYYLAPLDGTLFFVIVEPSLTVRGVSGGAIAANNNWQFVVGVCDVAEQEIRIYVDGALEGTTAIATGARDTGDANFAVGSMVRADGTGGTAGDKENRQLNAYVDKGFITSQVLSADDITFLYNAGAGRTFAEARAEGIV
jgi:hypothetical protein